MTKEIAQAHEDYIWGWLRLSGTRIPIQTIWLHYKRGYTPKQISTALYPQLSEKEIRRTIRWYQIVIVDDLLKLMEEYPDLKLETPREEIDKIYPYE